MNEDFNNILIKLKAFRKKYYLYEVLRGILIVTLISVFVYLLINTLEYFLYMPSDIRKVLFYTIILFILFLSVNFILLPLVKLTVGVKIKRAGKFNGLIQNHFPEIKDKLTNLLELSNLKGDSFSIDILEAALNQKSKELKLFDFRKAISFSGLKTLLFFILLSFTTVTVIYFVNKRIFTEPTKRIIHYNEKYYKPSPYTFKLLNNDLRVKKGERYRIELVCEGNEVPSVVYINIEGNDFIMRNKQDNQFEFDISSVTNQLHFYFTDKKYMSENYLLKIIPVPIVNNFYIEIKPPVYTNLKQRRIENIGDFIMPEGSEISWYFECIDTDSVKIIIDDQIKLLAEKKEENVLFIGKELHKPSKYSIIAINKNSESKTLMKCNIDVIEDLFPGIQVEQLTDSVQLTQMYFKGSIADDYGFTNLRFHLSSGETDTIMTLPVHKGLNNQEFYHTVNLNDFKSNSKNVSYYFSVTDNDNVNKPKTTISDTYFFEFPDEQEIMEKQKENYASMESLLLESQNITDEIKKEIRDLQIKNLNKNVTEWEKTQSINKIVNKKKYLENILKQIDNMARKGNEYMDAFMQQSDEIIKKQEEIEELLNDVMTDELKKLMEEFSKLAEEFNSKRFNELNNKLDMTLEDLSKQLDRNLEMLKKLRMEEEIRDLIKNIRETEKSVSEKIEKLEKREDYDEIKDDLKIDSDRTEELMKKAEEISDENNALKKPLIFDNFKSEFDDILKKIAETQLQISRKNKKNSVDGMKRTADMLDNIAFSMERMLDANEKEQKGENILTIKRLLKNVISLSANQERVNNDTQNSEANDPLIRSIKREQKVLIDQSQGIKDSLYALSMRSPQIGNIINEEIVKMSLNMIESLEHLNEGNLSLGSLNQRFVITSVNNIALFLSEVLNSMENSQENGGEGDENCESGKGSKMGGIKKAAENLKQQLQQLIDQMKKGQGNNMGQDLTQTLMQHELMQKMLRDLINSGQIGNEGRKQLQQIDQLLEQNRREIVNKRVNQNLVNRHNEIMVRLLEAEKSEKERDLDNKRESNTADEDFYSKPAGYFENNTNKSSTTEYLQSNFLKLNNFYKIKKENFIKKLNEYVSD